MREILFRGKRDKKYDKSQDWVYGVPYIDNEGDCIMADDCSKRVVDPETVGQYIGLTDDKSGKKIFEGDIVAVYVKGCRTICTVSWAETVAHFQLWQVNTVPGTPTALNLGNYDCEVIGNIHDNPELLKGGAE